jgi:carbamoyltransferase
VSPFIDYTISMQHLMQQVPRFDAARDHKGAEGVLDATWVNLARQTQGLLEEDMVFLAGKALARTESRNLCLAGGVALSCVTNRHVYDSGVCDSVFIQPASSDEGVPLGCALAGYYINGGRCRTVMHNAYLGAANSTQTIENTLRRSGMSYRPCDDRAVAKLLAEGKIVGRVFGGAEYGPRALGNRSILADPRRPYMTEVLNRRVKHRELFRPFAPSCHADKVNRYFDMPVEGPFMIFAAPVRAEARHLIPAIVHVDGSCRPQTVRPDQNPEYYNLIEEFGRLTGIYCLVNTSFNDNSEPIVETYEDALTSFLKTGLDYLYVDGFLVDRPAMSSAAAFSTPQKGTRNLEAKYDSLAEHFCDFDAFRRLRAELESRVEQPATRRDLLDVA